MESAANQQSHEQGPNWRLVLDDERARPAVGNGLKDFRWTWRDRGRFNRRQRQLEAGALRLLPALLRGTQHQRAAMRRGDPERDRQAEAGALPDLLRREERLEDPPLQVRLNPRPIVGHLERVKTA